MDKLLTVSIAAYNIEQYICETLDSILRAAEILNEIEIIVINDGSSDKTGELVKEYCKKYPETVRLIEKSNGGWGSTINICVKEARGKYFKILDGDDWFETDNLPGFIDFLREHDEDIMVTPYRRIFMDTGNEELVCKDSSLYRNNDLRKLKDSDICMHEISVKTERIKKLSITENCFYTDNEYVIKVLMYTHTVAYCNLSVYRYRLGSPGQSVSIEGIRKHYKDLETVIRNVGNLIENTELSNILPLKEKLGIILWTMFLYEMRCETPREVKKNFINLDREIFLKMHQMYELTMCNKHLRQLRNSKYLLLYPMVLYLNLSIRLKKY